VNRARLEKLEAAVTATVTPENRGTYCLACGGLRIEDVLLALETVDHGKECMTAEAANAVLAALETGEAACRKCGDVTLYGATLPMLGEEAEA
jgi:hypothetical protein